MVMNIQVTVFKVVTTSLCGITIQKMMTNIRTDLREIGFEGVEWIHLAQVQSNVSGRSCEHSNEIQVP
jgi:hypothetical protein